MMDRNSFNLKNFGIASGLGGIGAGAAGLFGGHDNPADAAKPYLEQIPGAVSPYYKPYTDAGAKALPQLQSQYGSLLNDPGGKLNQIGGSFQQSPGFKFALQQALQGSGHAAAAGGMAGSPQHEFQNMQIGTQLGNQDYYNWIDHSQHLYDQGLTGTSHMADQGLTAGTSLSDQIAQALSSQADLAYKGQANKNQAKGNDWGNLIHGVSTLAAFL